MRLPAVAVGLLVLFLGCSGSQKGGPVAAPTTTAAATPSAAAPTSTSAAPVTGRPVTTTAPATPCPLAAVPAGATAVATRSGDFDGDGVADTLRSYKAGADWHLRVELAGGRTGGDLVVPGVPPQTGLKPVGGFDVGGTRGDEAFAVVGSGASTDILGVFVFTGCTLVRATIDGRPAELAVGASALHRSGLSCVPGTALQTLEATAPSDTGTPFTVVRSTYDLMGSALVLANTSRATIASIDPALNPAAGLDCGRLSLS